MIDNYRHYFDNFRHFLELSLKAQRCFQQEDEQKQVLRKLRNIESLAWMLLYIYIPGNYACKKQGGTEMINKEKFDDIVKLRDLVLKAGFDGIGSDKDTEVYQIFGDLNTDKLLGVLYGLNKALSMLV